MAFTSSFLHFGNCYNSQAAKCCCNSPGAQAGCQHNPTKPEFYQVAFGPTYTVALPSRVLCWAESCSARSFLSSQANVNHCQAELQGIRRPHLWHVMIHWGDFLWFFTVFTGVYDKSALRCSRRMCFFDQIQPLRQHQCCLSHQHQLIFC